MTQLKTSFYRFVTCEEGAAAAEYALILAIVGAAIALAAATLGTTIAEALDDAGCVIKGTAVAGKCP